MRETAIQQKVT